MEWQGCTRPVLGTDGKDAVLRAQGNTQRGSWKNGDFKGPWADGLEFRQRAENSGGKARGTGEYAGDGGGGIQLEGEGGVVGGVQWSLRQSDCSNCTEPPGGFSSVSWRGAGGGGGFMCVGRL